MCLPHSAYLINGSFTDSASDCVTNGGGRLWGCHGSNPATIQGKFGWYLTTVNKTKHEFSNNHYVPTHIFETGKNNQLLVAR